MVMDKGIQIPKGQAPVYKKKGSKTPQKDTKKVLLYYVVPDMGLKIVFGANCYNAQRAQ